jgi:hypothetical protein
MIDFVQLSDTTHSYSGGGTGANSHDGNLATAQSADSGCSNGCSRTSLIMSEHEFGAAKLVKEIRFKSSAHGHTNGSTDNGTDMQIYVQWHNGDGNWQTVSGSLFTNNGSSGGGGGDVDRSMDPGLITLTGLSLLAKAVRAVARCSGFTNGSGNVFNTTVNIYEVQAFGDPEGYAAVI